MGTKRQLLKRIFIDGRHRRRAIVVFVLVVVAIVVVVVVVVDDDDVVEAAPLSSARTMTMSLGIDMNLRCFSIAPTWQNFLKTAPRRGNIMR